MSISVKGSFFLPGYAAVLCSFLSLSTYSYDEFDNGMAYIFHAASKAQGLCACKVPAGDFAGGDTNHCCNGCFLHRSFGDEGEITPMEYVISPLSAIALAFYADGGGESNIHQIPDRRRAG